MRLSAGREVMSDELQALCFLAGANSIFYGEKLLTTGNPDVARDRALLDAARYRAAGAAADSRPRRRTEPAEHVHGPGLLARGAATWLPHATRPGSAEGGARRSRAAPPSTHAPRGLARRRHQFLQQRLPRPAAIIPRSCARSSDAAAKYGVGSGASHLVTGHGPEHEALEDELAAFTGREKALVFSTGYMANMGVIGALADQNATIVSDKLNHASLIDGCRLTRRAAHGATGTAMRPRARAAGRRSMSPSIRGCWSPTACSAWMAISRRLPELARAARDAERLAHRRRRARTRRGRRHRSRQSASTSIWARTTCRC